MAAERHLPGRECEERYAAGTKIRPRPAHKLLLVGDVLDDIVTENQVELSFQLLHCKDVRSQETSLRTLFGEKPLSGPDFIFRQINPQDRTAVLRKGKQIATLPAAYLQHIDPFAYLHILRKIGDVVLPAGNGQLVEILSSVPCHDPGCYTKRT